MSGANAFIAMTKQFASKIFCAPHRSYQPSILSALGLSYSLTHSVWARFSQPRIGRTSARS